MYIRNILLKSFKRNLTFTPHDIDIEKNIKYIKKKDLYNKIFYDKNELMKYIGKIKFKKQKKIR